MTVQTIEVTIRGKKGSPLVVHAFSAKAKAEIEGKQQKKAKEAKKARDPQAEFEGAKCLDSEGRECVPLTAIKKSIINAATKFDDLTKVALRQAIFVDSAAVPGSALAPIETLDGKPAKGVMREDFVTIGMGKRDLRYRPGYEEWQTRLRVEFCPELVSEEQLRALLAHAGWGVGICEGRPEKTSALCWGRFEIAEEAKVKEKK